MKKRALAMISAVVMIVSSLYVTAPKVQAAEGGTVTITTKEYGLSLTNTDYKHHDGYMNLKYTTTVTDYANPRPNFLNKEFADQYITFGGGMTYDDLMNGMVTFYVATKDIIQFNWKDRKDAFTPGWSFTIAKGAQLPYATTEGTTGYMALDKEYTISFHEGNADNQHVVRISGLNTTTFSLGNLGIWGNGKSDEGQPISFNDANTGVQNYKTIYRSFVADESYKDYFQLGYISFEDLEKSGVDIRYILDDATRCIQIKEWGSLRGTMKAGDQLIFKKGFPITYTDNNGETWRATLDDTYVYECTGSNPDNTQVFYGVKLSAADTYGLTTRTSVGHTSEETSGGITSQIYNVKISDNTNTSTTYVYPDVMTDKVAEDYIQIAGFTIQEAAKMGIAIRYIPIGDALQIRFSTEAMEQLKEGDTIRLKKGMPVVYLDGETLKVATLDDTYVITIESNDSNRLGLTCVLDGSYRIKVRDLSQAGPEGNSYYYDIRFDGTLFEDAKGTFEGDFENKEELLRNYIQVSGKSAQNLIDDGWYLRRYHLDSFQALRFYCPQDKFDFKDGDTIILKKGFPISYTTKTDKTKIIRLEKDYGYVYDETSSKFMYDAALTGTPQAPEETPALTETHWCDIDHEIYTITDADTVTIDGETYQRGDTYNKLGEHTLTYEYYGKTYSRTLCIYRLGDGTQDGELNLKDYMHLVKYNQAKEKEDTNLAKMSMDMDANKEINDTDKKLLARYLMTDSGVMPVFPVNGSVTAYAGEQSRQLIDNYTPGKSESIRNGKDIYYREPATLRWFDYDGASSYIVKISLRPDMTDAKEYQTEDKTLSIQNLLADTDYYWTVNNGTVTSQAQRFHTEATIRSLTIDGVSNTRDGGGWTTENGGKIRQGMFFRGAKLENIKESGKAQMKELGIRTDLDLRNSTETSLVTSPLGADVKYVNYSGPYYWGEVTGINSTEYKEALVNEIKLFADANNYPIYVHCSLGRDRTGTICFLINALCGVTEKELYLDYEYSLLSSSGTADDQTANTMVMGNFKTMYDEVQKYAPNGSMADATETFMKSIGVTQSEIDSIRSILVEK